MVGKVRKYDEVMQHIPNHAVIGTTSFGMGGLAEQLLVGLKEYHEKHQQPQGLTFVSTAGSGISQGRGMDHLLAPGLLKRTINSYLGTSPLSGKKIQANEFEAYLLPQGIIGQLYSNAARQGPGVFSQVGIDTFIDPQQLGGKMNPKAHAAEDLVKEIELNGERWLHYQPLPINVAFIKATYADAAGNLSIQHETAKLEILALATAAHNAGGVVIAQVEEIVENDTLPARDVTVPGMLVDYVVKAEPNYHMQTPFVHYKPAFSNEIRITLADYHHMPLTAKKVVARRASLEFKKYSIVNLGFGIPAEIGPVLSEAGQLKNYHLTTDLGGIGGMPAFGYNYGPSLNPDAVIRSEDTFALYHGGGLETTVIGFGQMDAHGNINSTLLGDLLVGPGGLIDITHGAQHIIFVGNFTIGGKLSVTEKGAVIDQAGQAPKFVNQLPYITFSAKYARGRGKKITVITDRAVFEVNSEGFLCLTEIAPGLDLAHDILAWMEFEPRISDKLKVMDLSLYQEEWQIYFK